MPTDADPTYTQKLIELELNYLGFEVSETGSVVLDTPSGGNDTGLQFMITETNPEALQSFGSSEVTKEYLQSRSNYIFGKTDSVVLESMGGSGISDAEFAVLQSLKSAASDPQSDSTILTHEERRTLGRIAQKMMDLDDLSGDALKEALQDELTAFDDASPEVGQLEINNAFKM